MGMLVCTEDGCSRESLLMLEAIHMIVQKTRIQWPRVLCVSTSRTEGWRAAAFVESPFVMSAFFAPF